MSSSIPEVGAEPGAALFSALGLSAPLAAAVQALGYETPSPIQAATIPLLLQGRDVIGQAQTGTGKTAAFALPALQGVALDQRTTQVLVLAPTRELAIQVAEAFQRYAAQLPGFQVLPIYGGQSYEPQMRGLRRGAQVVVGTPGRVLDHLRQGVLKLDSLRTLILDEADEMLRMGFIDDVEEILRQTPATRQVALFSATMPPPIKRIAQTYLRNPAEIAIDRHTRAAPNVRQRYLVVGHANEKLDALTRLLETETIDGLIVFARTKLATDELAGKLDARGLRAASLNGDVAQVQRERVVRQFRDRQLDVIVATDVAARGLDVDRVSHVINFDPPSDSESYVHRIGRTGRAGRDGDAILFITPRERHLLRSLERATGQTIPAMALPSVQAVNERRIARFSERIDAILGEGGDASGLDLYRQLLADYMREREVNMLDVAAALATLVQGDVPLLLPPDMPQAPSRGERESRSSREGAAREPSTARPRREDGAFETFRVDVGSRHGVKPGNLVGAIASEADLESRHIGRIEIFDDYSLIELPPGMPQETQRELEKVWVCGRQLRLRQADSSDLAREAPRRRPPSRKPRG